MFCFVLFTAIVTSSLTVEHNNRWRAFPRAFWNFAELYVWGKNPEIYGTL